MEGGAAKNLEDSRRWREFDSERLHGADLAERVTDERTSVWEPETDIVYANTGSAALSHPPPLHHVVRRIGQSTDAAFSDSSSDLSDLRSPPLACDTAIWEQRAEGRSPLLLTGALH